MKIREEILEKFKAMGGVELSNKGALKQLQNALSPSESVKAVISGQNDGKAVVIAVTDQRLLFTFSLLGTHEVKDVPLSRITSINTGRNLMFGKLTVNSGGDITVFDHMNWKHAEEFATILRDTKNNSLEDASRPTQQTTTDVADRLLKLKQLLNAGVLTKDEYDAKAAPLKSSL
ncbi:MAG: PH domain-containing protein [Bifidobacterium sp.]|jgi:hypothetical protein|nr:PH domain-containing protein [Bifidobacterium sp.]MCI1864476.1 PH domain-containing protein [Bifidobacterium sp.]